MLTGGVGDTGGWWARGRLLAAPLACILLTAAVLIPHLASASDGVEPWAITSGTRFVDASGRQVILRGVNAHPSMRPDEIAATGANLVRIYVKWSDVEPTAPSGGVHAWSATALSKVDTLVSGLRDRGIHALIDFHQCGWSAYWASISSGCSDGLPAWYYADGRFPNTATGRANARAAWWTTEAGRSHAAYLPFVELMVERYRAYPNVIGYEIFNEPASGSLGPTTAATNSMLEWQAPVASAIRALDPWRAIVFMCRGGGEGAGTADLSKIGSHEHLVLDWHDYYNGAAGTGLNAAGDDWTPSWKATHMQETSPYAGTIDDHWAVLAVPVAKAAAAGIPLLIGEWGARKDDPNVAAYQSNVLQLYAEQGLSWARWIFGAADKLAIRNSDGTLNAAGRQLQSYLTGGSGFDPPPPASPPSLVEAPSISGSASIGATLSAGTGVWNGRPTSFAFAWERCMDPDPCAPIGGAGNATYVVQPADHGAAIRVIVTATNTSGSSEPAASAPTAPVQDQTVPVNVTPPTIGGTARIGQTLTAFPGSWTGEPTSYAFRWQRCTSACADIGGAASGTYKVAADDAGARLLVVVTAVNAAGPSAPAPSAPTGVVPLPPPAVSVKPSISGTPKVGSTLTASTGTWIYSPTSYAFQWQRCSSSDCSSISGATSSTFAPTPTQAGYTLRVKVTAANASGSTSATSNKTTTVQR